MLHPPTRFKPIRALAWITLLMVGCSTATAVPSPIPTSADNPTAGAIVRATRIVQATENAKSTAEAQATLDASATQAADRATQTEQAYRDATATAIALATREAILAARAVWPNRLHESFEDNQLNWPIGITKDNSLTVDSQIVANRYQWTVEVFNGNSYFNLVPDKGLTFSDFYAGVTIQFTEGSEDGMAAYGLTFRHVEDDYGFFGITRDGLFRVLEVHGTGIYQLWMSDSSAINTRPGAANRLAAIGVGPDFVFLINDQVVGQMNADIAPGQIGLGVDTLQSSPKAIVEFSDFQINAPE
jgi:hypothetical protein